MDYPQLGDGYGNAIRLDENGVDITTGPGLPFLVNGQPVGGGILKQQSVILSASDLENLSTTPILIVPGIAGVYLSISSVIVNYLFGTTPYVFDPSTYFAICIGGNTAPFLSNASLIQENLFSGTNNVLIDAAFGASLSVGPPVDPADLNGVGIYVSSYAGPDPSSGDGTIKFTVTYFEYNLS